MAAGRLAGRAVRVATAAIPASSPGCRSRLEAIPAHPVACRPHTLLWQVQHTGNKRHGCASGCWVALCCQCVPLATAWRHQKARAPVSLRQYPCKTPRQHPSKPSAKKLRNAHTVPACATFHPAGKCRLKTRVQAGLPAGKCLQAAAAVPRCKVAAATAAPAHWRACFCLPSAGCHWRTRGWRRPGPPPLGQEPTRCVDHPLPPPHSLVGGSAAPPTTR